MAVSVDQSFHNVHMPFDIWIHFHDFSAILKKVDNFCDFLFASLD